MITLQARNAHRALSHALYVMDEHGIKRGSRNGPVLQARFPVTTEYTHITERVVFWPQRDANPFYHLYEALWMLSGGENVRTLSRFTKNVLSFSDDGRTWHGAYGDRWREHFGRDQLDLIVKRLQDNPEDRRCVLQMWDAYEDLGFEGRDFPCNLMATVQRDPEGRLDLTVFCRSNDIVWGCYGSNVVTFSMLQEYLAFRIGCPVGTYRQVSVNWHAYLDQYEKLKDIPRQDYDDPYSTDIVFPVPMSVPDIDGFITDLMHDIDHDKMRLRRNTGMIWVDTVNAMMAAHEIYRRLPRPANYFDALALLIEFESATNIRIDWITAGKEWLRRRLDRYKEANDSL